MAEKFAARLTQAKLANKTHIADFVKKTKNINKNVPLNKKGI